MADAKDLSERRPSMTHQQKRSMAELLIRQIALKEDYIDISSIYLPALEEMGKSGSSQML